jgi:hypothetical protein
LRFGPRNRLRLRLRFGLRLETRLKASDVARLEPSDA